MAVTCVALSASDGTVLRTDVEGKHNPRERYAGATINDMLWCRETCVTIYLTMLLTYSGLIAVWTSGCERFVDMSGDRAEDSEGLAVYR